MHTNPKKLVCISIALFLMVPICSTEEENNVDSNGIKYAESPEISQVQNSDIFTNEKMVSMENIVNDHKTDDHLIHQSTELNAEDKDAVVFSVLESPKTPDTQEYVMEGQVITASDVSTVVPDPTPPATTKNKTFTVECELRILPEDEVPFVFIANDSSLAKVLTPPNNTNSTIGECTVVLFFSSECIFSARMAPHYNALPRVFPGVIFYALDLSKYYNVHMRYGIVSVPNVLLFHKAKPIARFNETQVNLENLASFVKKYTTLQYNGTLNVTSADMNGPVPAILTKKVDYILIVAWVFTLFCLCLGFLKSQLCHRIVESIKNTWQEAEAQHEHTD